MKKNQHQFSTSESPGENYQNWKQTAKEILKQRESVLMTTRCRITSANINESIEKFFCRYDKYDALHFVLPSEIKMKTMEKIFTTIDSWAGVNLDRLKGKKSIETFQEYFRVGKNHMDQCKKKVLGPLFYVKILDAVHSLSQQTDPSLARCLELQIVYGLLSGTIQFIQTKQQPLIPIGVVKQSNAIHQWLLKLDPSLTVHTWREEQKRKKVEQDRLQNIHCKRTGNAQKLVDKILNQLQELIEIASGQVSNRSITPTLSVTTTIGVTNTSSDTSRPSVMSKYSDEQQGVVDNTSSAHYRSPPEPAPIPSATKVLSSFPEYLPYFSASLGNIQTTVPCERSCTCCHCTCYRYSGYHQGVFNTTSCRYSPWQRSQSPSLPSVFQRLPRLPDYGPPPDNTI